MTFFIAISSFATARPEVTYYELKSGNINLVLKELPENRNKYQFQEITQIEAQKKSTKSNVWVKLDSPCSTNGYSEENDCKPQILHFSEYLRTTH